MNDRLLWFVPTIALAIGMIGLGMVQAERPPVEGHLSPAEFGLPTYPGAFDFKSNVTDPRSKSIAFKIHQGTSEHVAAFYRTEMKKRDYLLKEDAALPFPVPGLKPNQIIRNAPGRQLVFAHPKKAEAVLVWAIEHPVGSAPTQVVLGFCPLAQILPEWKATRAGTTPPRSSSRSPGR